MYNMLAQRGANRSGCKGLGRLLCGVPENGQRAGPSNLASCRGMRFPCVCPGALLRACRKHQTKRCRGGTEAFAGCSRSDAVTCGARGWQNTACWRSAERTSLVCDAWVSSFAGLYSNRQRAGPASLTSCLVRTRFGRTESRRAKLRGAASSAHSPRLPSMYHVRGDQQEAPAVSLL